MTQAFLHILFGKSGLSLSVISERSLPIEVPVLRLSCHSETCNKKAGRTNVSAGCTGREGTTSADADERELRSTRGPGELTGTLLPHIPIS